MYLDEIGQIILHARKNQKLSQQQLASQLGMSRATLSALENGTIAEIGIRKIMAICAALGLELMVQQKVSRPTLQQLIKEQQRA
jgi:transcriptional regulator with XRE-family HTH domain